MIDPSSSSESRGEGKNGGGGNILNIYKRRFTEYFCHSSHSFNVLSYELGGRKGESDGNLSNTTPQWKPTFVLRLKHQAPLLHYLTKSPLALTWFCTAPHEGRWSLWGKFKSVRDLSSLQLSQTSEQEIMQGCTCFPLAREYEEPQVQAIIVLIGGGL